MALEALSHFPLSSTCLHLNYPTLACLKQYQDDIAPAKIALVEEMWSSTLWDNLQIAYFLIIV